MAPTIAPKDEDDMHRRSAEGFECHGCSAHPVSPLDSSQEAVESGPQHREAAPRRHPDTLPLLKI